MPDDTHLKSIRGNEQRLLFLRQSEIISKIKGIEESRDDSKMKRENNAFCLAFHILCVEISSVWFLFTAILFVEWSDKEDDQRNTGK